MIECHRQSLCRLAWLACFPVPPRLRLGHASIRLRTYSGRSCRHRSRRATAHPPAHPDSIAGQRPAWGDRARRRSVGFVQGQPSRNPNQPVKPGGLLDLFLQTTSDLRRRASEERRRVCELGPVERDIPHHSLGSPGKYHRYP